MFNLHQSLDYYLYPFPVDMRKSFFTLSGIVNNEMNRDVRQGGVFIFINRRQNIIKILHMEYAGLVIYHKKLESGRLRLPSFDENTDELIFSWHDLMTMIQEVKPRQKSLQRTTKSFNKTFAFS